MTAPPGPRPPGSPGDCEAVAALCDAYAGVLENELRSASRPDIGWSGSAAEHVRQALNRWQNITGPAAQALRELAGRLRRMAIELEHEQAVWRRRVDTYAELVRDQSRWGRT